jgi:phage-related tail fiber protein
MANTIRIKRRDGSGGAGAPTSLANAELAFNEASDILYYGKGTGGAGGTATIIEAIGGSGAFVGLSGTQTINGNKTFSALISGSISGNAGTASTLQTSRTLSLGGDVSGSVGFNGSADVSITSTLSNTGVVAGTYGSTTTSSVVQVDSKGRITSASSSGIAFPVTSVNTKTGALTLSTSDIGEGTNLYYTDARVRLNRLDQLAVPTSTVSFNNQTISNLGAPALSSDAATKSYVDSVAQGAGNAPFESVQAVSVSNITLSGAQTIDGVSLVANNRVLVVGQTTASANGIYVVSAGTWARASDADTTGELKPGKQVYVNAGTVYGDSVWAITNDTSITVETTPIGFTQISGLGQVSVGTGLSKTGNTISVVEGTGITTAGGIGLTGQALALHQLSVSGLIARTGSGTVTSRSVAVSGSGISVTNGNGIAGNPTLELATNLGAIAQVSVGGDSLVYFTGSAAAASTTLTSYGRSLIDDSSASEARSTLGLGTMATQLASSVNITGGTIDGVTLTSCILDGGTF